MCIVKSLPSLISLTRTWYYAMFIMICMFYLLNGAMVTHDIKKDLEKTFAAQIDILSLESQEVIALNYSILDNIVAKLTSSNPENIAKNFAQYTHTIGQYTNNIIFLTSPQKDIIQITPNTKEVSEHFSAENHTQIKIHLTENNNTLLTNHLFIGPIVRVHSENTWGIPITKTIMKGDKDLGTVVWVAHLEKFSDSLLKLNMTLKLHEGHEKRPDCYIEADHNTPASNIKNTISYHTILGAILAPKGDILASEGSHLIHGTTRYVTLAMPAKHIQKLFWNKFNYNFIIFSFCTFAILFVVLSKISRLAHQVKNIENILVQSAIILQHLIPGFATLT